MATLETSERVLRHVTVRELSRNFAAVLNEIEFEKKVILVSRYHRPVAIVAPFGEIGPIEQLAQSLLTAKDRDEPEEESSEHPAPPALDLEPNQRRVFDAIRACEPRPWQPADVQELRVATRMEIAGLLRRVAGGYRIVVAGR